MSCVARALWFVEHNLAEPFALGDAAAAAGVGPHHLARAFQSATGHTVMGYARARRLSEAARALAEGRRDILGLALETGYGSHEAFTRAFRDHFGVTPEAARAGAATSLNLTENLPMTDIVKIRLPEPRFAERPAFRLAGYETSMGRAEASAIPALWGRFATHFGHVPNQIGGDAYGLCRGEDDQGRIAYLAGVEVSRFDDLPAEFARASLPAARYAAFRVETHVSELRHAFAAVYDDWLPASGLRAAGVDFERYGPEFDAARGAGAIELWIAVSD
jgi:AraC family transcriptional regulator